MLFRNGFLPERAVQKVRVRGRRNFRSGKSGHGGVGRNGTKKKLHANATRATSMQLGDILNNSLSVAGISLRDAPIAKSAEAGCKGVLQHLYLPFI